jgi:hypothetical protein
MEVLTILRRLIKARESTVGADTLEKEVETLITITGMKVVTAEESPNDLRVVMAKTVTDKIENEG